LTIFRRSGQALTIFSLIFSGSSRYCIASRFFRITLFSSIFFL